MKKQLVHLVLIAACISFLSGAAPAYWVQTPDLSADSMDVNAWHIPWVAGTTILGDDFVVTKAMDVETIILWGGMKNDVGSASDFSIGISTDNGGQPGTSAGSSSVTVTTTTYAEGLAAGWVNPNTEYYEYIPAADTICYQWELTLDTPISLTPGCYWFTVTIRSLNDVGNAGWKTSADASGSGALFKGADSGGWFDFQSLTYPAGHSDEGEAVSLAFAIIPEPTTVALLAAGGFLGLLRRRSR